MRIRKPEIPESAVAGARTVRGAVTAALRSPEAAEAIDRIVAKAGYRRYRAGGPGWSREAVLAAVGAFFATGSLAKARSEISTGMDATTELAELLDDIKLSQPFSAILESAAASVVRRFPRVGLGDARARIASVLAGEIAEAIIAADRSEPVDAVRGTEVVVCYVPGLSKARRLEDTMTSCWTASSSSLTVKPDAAMMRLLSLANVSVGQWLDAVEEVNGERLDAYGGGPEWTRERAAAWSEAEAACDPSSPPLVKPKRLVEAVDACWLGFTPMIAFSADAATLLGRDWDRALGVKGGVLGLHDFVNGSGDPLRFEQKAVFTVSPSDMMVGEARDCDFEQVHGFVRQSFRSRLTDEDAPAPLLKPSL